MTNKKVVRVIPRLDIKGPNVVKGLQFDGFRVLGLAEDFAALYFQEGADEIIYQDTVASLYQRDALLEVIRKTAEKLFVPITVAGGIRTIENIREILRAGADKVAINTAAIANPNLLREGSEIFGSQCIVASIEYHSEGKGKYECWVDYGRQPTGVQAFDWARKVVDLGVGEILLSSIDREGLGTGYDLEFIRKVSDAVPIPVIASCGAGKKEDLVSAVKNGHAEAVSVASCFHYAYTKPVDQLWMSFNEARLRMGEQIDSGNIDFINDGYGKFREISVKPFTVREAKDFMKQNGIRVRDLKIPFTLTSKNSE